MKASFLITANAFERLGPAATERGWQSDPDYAQRTVQRALASRQDLERGLLSELAAMCGEFPARTLEEVACAIGRFFGERPLRLECDGVEYAVGRTLAAVAPVRDQGLRVPSPLPN